MNKRNLVVIAFVIILLVIAGVIFSFNMPAPEASSFEQVVQEINLSGDVTDRNTEVSGLTWYGDNLIILPQFGGVLYSIPRDEILAYLDGDSTAIEPDTIEITVSGEVNVAGFQGYEAIVFIDDTAYLTIESNDNGLMRSYLISGTLSDSTLTIETASIVPLQSPANVDNKGHESMVVYDGLPLPLYEWNRYDNNNTTESWAMLIDDGQQGRRFSLPAIPYRMTDATDVDENGRFRVIVYHFPDSDTARVEGYSFDDYLEEGTHAVYEQIESLIELQINEDDTITWIDQAPLLLALEADPRNWEGLARLDERNGFLLMTDKFPDTQLVFVELPESHPANQ